MKEAQRRSRKSAGEENKEECAVWYVGGWSNGGVCDSYPRRSLHLCGVSSRRRQHARLLSGRLHRTRCRGSAAAARFCGGRCGSLCRRRRGPQPWSSGCPAWMLWITRKGGVSWLNLDGGWLVALHLLDLFVLSLLFTNAPKEKKKRKKKWWYTK